jgi:predicted DNA-binding transcriptional regulator AlpA
VARAPVAIEPLLSRRDLANVLRTSLRSLDRLQASGRLPKPDMYLSARQPRWRAETIRTWIDQQTHG